jgi:hypothetical protein
MDTQKISLIILAVVLVFGVAGLFISFNTATEGAATYQQVIHRNREVYVPFYNVCARGPCGEEAVQVGHVQPGEPNFLGTAVCECPDGTRFQTDYHRQY